MFPVTRATRRASAVRQKRQRHGSGSGTDSLQQPSPLSGQSPQRFFAECCLIFCLRQPSCPAQGPAMHDWTLLGRRLDGIEGKPFLYISCWPELPVPCHGFVFVFKNHKQANRTAAPAAGAALEVVKLGGGRLRQLRRQQRQHIAVVAPCLQSASTPCSQLHLNTPAVAVGRLCQLRRQQRQHTAVVLARLRSMLAQLPCGSVVQSHEAVVSSTSTSLSSRPACDICLNKPSHSTPGWYRRV